MKNAIRSLALCASALALAAPVYAATLTVGGLDIGWTDNNNQNWLRLDDPALLGYNYYDYMNGLNIHGYSWRLASMNEIAALWGEFEPQAADGIHLTGGTSGNSVGGAIGAFNIMDALGYTYVTTDRSVYLRGMASDLHTDTQGNPLWGYSPSVMRDPLAYNYYSEQWTLQGRTIDPNLKSTGPYTAWMIGAPISNVPVPASGLLLLSAFGVAGVARGRSKKR